MQVIVLFLSFIIPTAHSLCTCCVPTSAYLYMWCQGAAAYPENEDQQQRLREAAEGLRVATNAAAQNAIKKKLISRLGVSDRNAAIKMWSLQKKLKIFQKVMTLMPRPILNVTMFEELDITVEYNWRPRLTRGCEISSAGCRFQLPVVQE